jgi:uncharacterized protein (TIGR02145 family)
MKKPLALLFVVVSLLAACSKSDDSNEPVSEYPATPASPVPAGNLTNAPIDGVLSWQPCADAQGDPVTYMLMVDTNRNLTTPFFVSQNLTASTCTVPGLMRISTYYWRVIATDNHNNISTGPIWKFTTRDHDFGSFTDARDGKTYRTIKIGNLTWMADNLAYIPPQGEYMYPFGDSTLASEYGILYGAAESYLSTLAPAGWHIPTSVEFDALGFENGGHLKMPGTDYWVSSNADADNSTGFSAKGAGGYYYDLRHHAYFGALFEMGMGYQAYFTYYLEYDSKYLFNSYMDSSSQFSMFSIRCVKD